MPKFNIILISKYRFIKDRGKDLKKGSGRQVAQNAKRSVNKKNTESQQLAKRSNSPKSDDSDEDDQFITSYETISIQVNC